MYGLTYTPLGQLQYLFFMHKELYHIGWNEVAIYVHTGDCFGGDKGFMVSMCISIVFNSMFGFSIVGKTGYT